jgi:SAM-dependent methyltransferase
MGKTYTRSYLDCEIRKNCRGLKGEILDLGSGGAQYKRIFDKDCKVTCGDIDTGCGADIIFDANKKFPIKQGRFDNIFCMNLIEHLNNSENCINECHRVLKKGGRLYLSMVFLYPFHADPNDFVRYTHEGMMHRLKSTGFDKIKIKRLGGRGAIIADTFASLMPTKIIPMIFRVISYPAVWILDNLILSNTERRIGRIYYQTSFIIAEK